MCLRIWLVFWPQAIRGRIKDWYRQNRILNRRENNVCSILILVVFLYLYTWRLKLLKNLLKRLIQGDYATLMIITISAFERIHQNRVVAPLLWKSCSSLQKCDVTLSLCFYVSSSTTLAYSWKIFWAFRCFTAMPWLHIQTGVHWEKDGCSNHNNNNWQMTKKYIEN